MRLPSDPSHLNRFEWFQGEVLTVSFVAGRKSAAEILYDDGDRYTDYFDGRPGSLKYHKLTISCPE